MLNLTAVKEIDQIVIGNILEASKFDKKKKQTTMLI